MNADFPLRNALQTTSAHLGKLEKMGLFSVRDLLEFFPRAVESTEISSDFAELELGKKNTISGTLQNFRVETSPRRGKKLGRAEVVLDDGAEISVIWFQIPYILKNIRENTRVFLVGKLGRDFSGEVQISNPEVHLDRGLHVGALRAIYPESKPITSKWLREKIAGLSVFCTPENFPDPIPNQILAAEKLEPKFQSVAKIHAPKTAAEFAGARARLGFEEVFLIQIRVLREKIQRAHLAEKSFPVPLGDAQIAQVRADLKTLPFELTAGQKKSLFEILKDLAKDRPARRLLQGDVGAGKTIVAFLAAAATVRAGGQVAILAPTSILAAQHFASAAKFFAAISPKNAEKVFGFRVEILTGATPAKKKKEIKSALAAGEIDVLVGTHAILTPDTEFAQLALAVVDEQHRFGVQQRHILARAGTHQISMTATPIPRTLALTLYGDQDLSVISELPAGRKKIVTRVVPDERTRGKMNLFLEDQMSKNRQIFWVCPLIAESEKMAFKAVLTEFENVSATFPNRKVALLHGQMRPKEKDEIMEKFKNREFDVLVSTSVIEVGVDIPGATAMIIENAERFGLAQLHQFRGRIGRNDLQSYCFLLPGEPEMKNIERLRAMEKFHSGFDLAEIDLKLRGAGEMYGTRQSGIPDLKVADLTDSQMLEKTRRAAEKILEISPDLEAFPMLRAAAEKETVFWAD